MLATPKEVVAFRAQDGRVPFEEWLDDLNDKKAVARIPARLARVQKERCVRTVSYKKILRKRLYDPEQAAEYLTACYEDGPEVFLVGLRDVVEAPGGVARAAELSQLNRESLYRFFSRNGNPRLSSFNAVLSSLGLKVTFQAV